MAGKTAKIGSKIVLEGEQEYRQAIKNITADQKQWKSEMSLLTAEFANNQNSLEALSKKQEILGKEVESQAEKVDVYRKAVAESSEMQENAAKRVEEYAEKLEAEKKAMEEMAKASDVSSREIKTQQELINELTGKLEQAEAEYQKAGDVQQQWQTKLNLAQADLATLREELNRTNRYVDEATASQDGCATSIDNVGREMKAAGNEASTFGDVLKANLASEAIIAGISRIADMLKQCGSELLSCATGAMAFADNVNTLAAQTGMSTDTIQALMYAEDLLDVSVNTVTSSMAKNIRSMNNAKKGSESYVKAYQRLNVEFKDANGNLRNSEEVYWDVIDALKNVTDQTERDSIAMELFGRNAQELNTLINAGSSQFKQYKQEAEEVGYILSGETLDGLNQTQDAFDRFNKKLEASKNEIGAEFAPTVEKGLALLSDGVDVAQEAIEGLLTAIDWMIEHADVIGGVMAGAAGAFVVYKVATEGATVATAAWNAILNMNPIILLASALAGLTIGLVAFASSYKSESKKIIDANEESVESVEKVENEREKSREAREKEIASMQSNIKIIQDLNAKEKLTYDEKKKVKYAVDALNKSYEGLNLTIDEQTGKVIESTSEVSKRANEMERMLQLENLEADNAALLENRVAIEQELDETIQRRTETQEKLAEAQRRYEEILEEQSWNAAADPNADIIQYQYILDYEEALESCNVAIEEQTAKLEHAEQVYYENCEEIDTLKEKINQAKAVYIEWGGETHRISSDFEADITDIINAYNEAKDAADRSIKAQVSLFEELNGQSDKTAEEMGKAWESQTKVYNQYSEDMTAAMELVSKGLLDEGLLGDIKELGVDGAGYLHELVATIEADSSAGEDLMNQFAEMQEARNKMSESIAYFEEVFGTGLEEMIREGEEAGRKIAESIGDGIVNNAYVVKDAVKATMDDAFASGNVTDFIEAAFARNFNN